MNVKTNIKLRNENEKLQRVISVRNSQISNLQICRDEMLKTIYMKDNTITDIKQELNKNEEKVYNYDKMQEMVENRTKEYNEQISKCKNMEKLLNMKDELLKETNKRIEELETQYRYFETVTKDMLQQKDLQIKTLNEQIYRMSQ